MNKYKTIIRSIIIFLFFTFSSYLQYIPVILFKLDVNKIRGNMRFATYLSMFSSIIVSIVLLIVYNKELKHEFTSFKNNIKKDLGIGFKYYFLGIFIMITSNFILYYFFSSGGANNQNIVQSMINASPILMFIDAGLVAPFNEEIVYRKTLYDVFKNKKTIFVLLSFFLFGLAHVSTARNIVEFLYIIPYGALGGAFALTYSETDSVFTSMFIHMFHNIFTLILSIMI